MCIRDRRDAEQRLPLQTAGIAHLLGDGGGQEGDAAEGTVRHVGAVACHHHHRHGLADGTADAQHNACGNAAFGCRDADLEPCFGVGGTQCQTALLILRRHGIQRRDRHGHDAGQDHDGKHHDSAQQAGTGSLAEGLCHGRHQHLHAQQAEHHAGDAGQQLDGGDHHGAQLGAVGDVVVNAHGERIGLLEHHAHPAAQVGELHFPGKDVLALEPHIALDAVSYTHLYNKG